MLWNVSWDWEAQSKAVVSKELFANWELIQSTGGKRIWLCSGFLSLCCDARSSWSSCYLSFKKSIPPKLTKFVLCKKYQLLCFPWKWNNNLFHQIHPDPLPSHSNDTNSHLCCLIIRRRLKVYNWTLHFPVIKSTMKSHKFSLDEVFLFKLSYTCPKWKEFAI